MNDTNTVMTDTNTVMSDKLNSLDFNWRVLKTLQDAVNGVEPDPTEGFSIMKTRQADGDYIGRYIATEEAILRELKLVNGNIIVPSTIIVGCVYGSFGVYNAICAW